MWIKSKLCQKRTEPIPTNESHTSVTNDIPSCSNNQANVYSLRIKPTAPPKPNGSQKLYPTCKESENDVEYAVPNKVKKSQNHGESDKVVKEDNDYTPVWKVSSIG